MKSNRNNVRVSALAWLRQRFYKAADKKRFTQRGYAEFFRSRSHDAVIRVYDRDGNVIATHEHTGDFKGFQMP